MEFGSQDRGQYSLLAGVVASTPCLQEWWWRNGGRRWRLPPLGRDGG